MPGPSMGQEISPGLAASLEPAAQPNSGSTMGLSLLGGEGGAQPQREPFDFRSIVQQGTGGGVAQAGKVGLSNPGNDFQAAGRAVSGHDRGQDVDRSMAVTQDVNPIKAPGTEGAALKTSVLQEGVPGPAAAGDKGMLDTAIDWVKANPGKTAAIAAGIGMLAMSASSESSIGTKIFKAVVPGGGLLANGMSLALSGAVAAAAGLAAKMVFGGKSGASAQAPAPPTEGK